jgi:hypothetical protein
MIQVSRMVQRTRCLWKQTYEGADHQSEASDACETEMTADQQLVHTVKIYLRKLTVEDEVGRAVECAEDCVPDEVAVDAKPNTPGGNVSSLVR